MTAKEITHEMELMAQLVDFFQAGPGRELSRHELYELIVEKLNKIAGRSGADLWTYRYTEGVHKGTVKPSKVFIEAVNHLGSTLEADRPAAYEGAEPVQVFALPGRVKVGAIVLGESVQCENPRCRTWFVPPVPWQKYCRPACGTEARKIKKESGHE